MKIQNTPNNYINKNHTVSSKGAREVVRTLSNPDALMSVICLESFVTGGRSINAYKRGGFPEFRERFTDDVVSAVFWMKGVDIFNKLGNKFGEKVLKLPTTEFDVGKDALRTPFKNLVSDVGEKLNDTGAVKDIEKKLAAFKFTKIITSTLLATGFVGFVLPKLNQKITSLMMGKKNNTENENNKENSLNKTLSEQYSFENFDKKISSNNKPAFKGISPDKMAGIAHYLENNKICKMLSCDAGITSGRVITARNKDEGIEYLFRDTSSLFFYFASTPLIYKGLQKLTNSANITNIDPVASKQLSENMLNVLNQTEQKVMPSKEFAKKVMGHLDDKAKDIMSKLEFNSDVISLTKLKEHIADEKIIDKAMEMAKLQPQQAGVGHVLTKQQVLDVLKDGSINKSEFMQQMYKSKFGEKLTNPYKFIPMKRITSFRDNMDKYIQSVIDCAEKTNKGIIDANLIEKMNKKGFMMSAGFRFIALGISALALGFAIPKLQYAITERKTGSKQAPGLRNYSEKKS